MLNWTFNSGTGCIVPIRVLCKEVSGCCCIIGGFRNFRRSEDRKIKSCLDDVFAVFQDDEATSLLINSSGPNPFQTGLEKSVLDRLGISKIGGNRAIRSLS